MCALRYASFNGDLSNWDVSDVTGMSGTFCGADAFDQNLGMTGTSYLTMPPLTMAMHPVP